MTEPEGPAFLSGLLLFGSLKQAKHLLEIPAPRRQATQQRRMVDEPFGDQVNDIILARHVRWIGNPDVKNGLRDFDTIAIRQEVFHDQTP